MIMNTARFNLLSSPSGTQAAPDRFFTYLCALLAVGLLVTAWPSLVRATTLDDVSYQQLSNERVQVKLSLSGSVKEPLSFAVDNPARIALDFPNVGLNLKRKTQTIGVGMARSITAVEAGGRTRVVLNLIKLVPYDIQKKGNAIYLTLDSAGSAQSRAFVETAKGSGETAARHGIENIDFRRGDNGEGRVIITLSDPDVVIDSREEGGKIIIDYVNSTLPERLERKLDVVDFATPVKMVDTFAQGDGVRMIVYPVNDNYEHLAYQSDNLFTLELKPLSKEELERARREKVGFTGEKLSLNFQNIEVRAVLQLLADFTGLNLVASDTVGGNVTLRLKNVPWDQALDIILKSRGLGMRKVGNVLMVAPSEEIAAREKLELESQKQISELAPLRTEFIQINYAKASEIATLLKAKENSLLSGRGNVSIDTRTNTLLVRDTSDNLDAVRGMVAQLDIPVRQVLIESRIVIADDNFSRDLGVKFGYTAQDLNLNGDQDNFGAIGGALPGDLTLNAPIGVTTEDTQPYLVDLPIGGPSGALGIVVGKVGTWLLQLELQAMQAEGRGEVISNPRVITSNQQQATIEQGTEIPYQEASSSGATSVSFKKAVLSLNVTPQITPDDRIIMDLNVNKDSVGQTFGGIPSVDTRSVTTQVLVDNGETVVLGGIYEQTKRNDTEQVPFFGDLPVVGHLFKTTSNSDRKNELLVFVTPKILKEGLSLE